MVQRGADPQQKSSKAERKRGEGTLGRGGFRDEAAQLSLWFTVYTYGVHSVHWPAWHFLCSASAMPGKAKLQCRSTDQQVQGAARRSEPLSSYLAPLTSDIVTHPE